MGIDWSHYVLYHSFFHRRREARRLVDVLSSSDARWIEVQRFSGAAFAISATDFDAVGGFDEQFFCYGEDMDLCTRLAAQNVRLEIDRQVVVEHWIGTGSVATARMRSRLQAQGELQFTRRHIGRGWACVQALQLIAAAVLKAGTGSEARKRLAGRLLACPVALGAAIWRPDDAH